MLSTLFNVVSAAWLLLAIANGASVLPSGLPSAATIIAHSTGGTGGACCQALTYVLGTKVAYPLSVAYTGTLAEYFSSQEALVQPNCIVEPTSTQDVSTAVYVLSIMANHTSFSNECKFAIKSGGHTPQAGAANQQAGVTINLAGLNQVTVNSDQTVTSIGPGNRWLNVYTTLDPLNLAIPGGRVADVGVGGLVTGGGISFFSGRNGFVCDNVLNFELVLPYGKVVDVNSSSDPDLFQSLKGGSNNFGIVTRFDMKTFQEGPFWGGLIMYPSSTASQQQQAFATLANANPYDEYAALIHSYAYIPVNGTWLIVNDYEYTKNPVEPYPPTFQQFTSIKPEILNTMRTAQLTSFTTEISLVSQPTLVDRRLYITVTTGVTAAMVNKIYELAKSNVQPIKNVLGLLYTISFQPVPTAYTTKATASNPNSLGLGASDGNLMNALISVGWSSATDDAAVYAAVENWLSQSIAAAQAAGLYNKYIYLNYAFQTQNPIAGYGTASQSRLQSVSHKYDPDQIFQKAVPGGFKLS